MSQQYTEKDWQIFRMKICEWQEAYIDKLNKEYVLLLSSSEPSSTKFWELEKKINEDKHKAGVICKRSRSYLIENIVRLLHEKAITFDDLEEFSDELKEAIKNIMNLDR